VITFSLISQNYEAVISVYRSVPYHLASPDQKLTLRDTVTYMVQPDDYTQKYENNTVVNEPLK
jgi:hypothetical protein